MHGSVKCNTWRKNSSELEERKKMPAIWHLIILIPNIYSIEYKLVKNTVRELSKEKVEFL